MAQRSKAKDGIATDNLSVGSLELHRQSTENTIFNSNLNCIFMVDTQQVWEKMTCWLL
jgi:hypothetical protein